MIPSTAKKSCRSLSALHSIWSVPLPLMLVAASLLRPSLILPDPPPLPPQMHDENTAAGVVQAGGHVFSSSSVGCRGTRHRKSRLLDPSIHPSLDRSLARSIDRSSFPQRAPTLAICILFISFRLSNLKTRSAITALRPTHSHGRRRFWLQAGGCPPTQTDPSRIIPTGWQSLTC